MTVGAFKFEVPYDYRTFKTVTGNPNVPNNTVTTINWGALGDIRLEGIYTGFFADQSAGVTFGLKLPTGDWTYNNAYGDVDRDSEIGTGSTDILLGGFYRGNITKDRKMGLVRAGIAGRAGADAGSNIVRASNSIRRRELITRDSRSVACRISPVAQAIFFRSATAVTCGCDDMPIPPTPATSASCFRRESNFTFIR